MPVYTVLPLTSCYQCRPDKWKPGKDALNKYRCTACGKDVKQVCDIVDKEDRHE